MKLSSLFLVIVLLSMLAIAHTKITSRAIEGKVWRLVSYDRKPIPIANGGVGSITLEFSAGNMEGSGGCNNYEGKYQLLGNLLIHGGIAFTERGCASMEKTKPENNVMVIESDYFERLSTVWLITDITADAITLRSSDGGLRFEAVE